MWETRRIDAPAPHWYREGLFGGTEPSSAFIKKLEIDGKLENPIVVTPDDEIIDGVKRWKAAKALGWQEIPVVVRNYDDVEAEKWAVLRNNDYREMTFSQKVRFARESKALVKPMLEKRQQAGKSIAELGEDDPAQEIASGENINAREWAADDVNWNRETLRQAEKIWELANSDGLGSELASELVRRLDDPDTNIGVSSAYEEIKPHLNSGSESASENPEQSQENSSDNSPALPVSEGEYHFLPIIGKMASGLMSSHEGNTPVRINGQKVSWWENDSIIPRYPFVFISPFGDGNVPADNYEWRDAFRFDGEDVFVISDSGGYQLMSESGEQVDERCEHSFAKGCIHPETMLEWQVRNADAGPILDHPPFAEGRDPKAFSDFKRWEKAIFRPLMEKTAENAERMSKRLAEMREDGEPGAEEFTQLGVIQGRLPRGGDTDEWYLVEDWHQRMEEAMVSVDGWALSAKRAQNLYHQATVLSYAATEFENPDHIHVLQAGSPPHLALLEFFAMLTGWSVTSAALVTISRGSYYKFAPPVSGHSTTDLSLGRGKGGLYPLDRFPCRCSVCRSAEIEAGTDYLLGSGSKSLRGPVYSLHNLHQLLMFKNQLAALVRKYGRGLLHDLEIVHDAEVKVKNNNRFWQELRRPFNSDRRIVELWRAMRAVDLAIQNGRESQTVRDLLRGGRTNLEMDAMAW